MKTIIHLKSTQDKYPWLRDVLAHEEKYMEMAGLLGGGGSTSVGGKPIPAALREHNRPDNALTLDKNSFTIEFDPSGADRDFIQKVPLTFSLDGGEPYSPTPPSGWTYQKTDTSIIFSNANPEPPKVMIKFDPAGTEYQTGGGGFTSAQDAYDKALQLWVCIECNDRHVQHSQKKLPLEAHQRMIYLPLNPSPERYYAALGGFRIDGEKGGKVPFKVYRHEEDMTSTYNLQLYKYDHETGKPLEDSVFKLYERFDDKDQINQKKDGPVQIYKGGAPYKSYHTDNPVVWDNFKFVSGLSTDENGYVSKKINHGYHYDKTFCDGHPAPPFVAVPEEEEDEETGETTNEDAIQDAQAENKRLANDWLNCFAACQARAAGEFDGVHFHWLMPEVNQGVIQDTADNGGSEGSTPDGGKRTSASGDESYGKSGCKDDCEATYDKFIALRYSYALVESTARPGYIQHDIHTDDLPTEVITTDSSENGANAEFAHEYGKDIVINENITYSFADETLQAREEMAAYQMEESDKEPEDVRLKKGNENYLQKLLRFLVPQKDEDPDTEPEDEAFEDAELIDDVTGLATPGNSKNSQSSHTPPPEEKTATPANAGKATPSDAARATSSDAACRAQVIFSDRSRATDSNWRAGESAAARGTRLRARAAAESAIFTQEYNAALNGPSSGAENKPGPAGNFSHCNNQDGEKDAWRIYDHRTEGELHINKRDMALETGEAEDYDSYGDSQGDGTLEGAVYGLFAATDILHPDGKTGVVYKANNLVAAAATDRNGDASFMANTEAPGHIYDYSKGAVRETDDGWAEAAPKNLYTAARTCDDYTEDGKYVRTYPDYEAENGSCWIGRPLLMGSYYIKELTRSEGYELSIGNKDSALTNKGQDCNAALPVGVGYANVAKNLYAEGQISAAPTGKYGDPDIDELFFRAESRGTGAFGYDIVLDKLPDGVKIYRLDTGTERREVQVGTGVFDKVYLKNADGSPKYLTAENDYQYPKYQADGSLMTVETSVNFAAGGILTKEEKPLDPEKTQAAIEGREPSMTQPEVAAKLAEDFDLADTAFFKGKVERALRASGKNTPRRRAGQGVEHSGIDAGIFDAGVREGEPDAYGVSGVAPGEPAAKTVYGSPVVTIEIPKTDDAGSPVKVGDAVLSVLDYYNTNSFYSYGGIDAVEETADVYLVRAYASVSGNPANYMVCGSDPETDSVIYHRITPAPDDSAESPRYVYAAYSNNPDRDAFGTYENYQAEVIGGTLFSAATLITDAEAAGDGSLVSRTVKKNVYYKTGERPLDADGNPMQAFEYREQTVTSTQETEANEWTELPVRNVDGKTVIHMDSTYTDRYGAPHGDANLQQYFFRILLPEKEITLTQADIDSMDGTDWSAGEKMGSASYYAKVRHAKAKAYLNYADLSVTGDSSFVQPADLVYPGQQYTYQDGEHTPGTNTRAVPAGVQERTITQKIRVWKDITAEADGSYPHNTYENVHKDNLSRDFWGRWLTRTQDWLAKLGDTAADKGTSRLAGFRFKVYLKSNLERLYRDGDGTVIWMDRNGNPVDIAKFRGAFPERVQKLYTKVLHTGDIKRDSREAAVANRALYSFSGGLIHDGPNSGYTSVLEAADTGYQYEKFFDAVRTADTDRWDNPLGRGRQFASWEDWDSVRNAWEGIVDPSNADTSYKPFARIPAGQFSASAGSAGMDPALHDGAETKNEVNTSPEAKKNAMSSDAVRQFAVTWYLDEEVKKLVRTDANGERENAGPDAAYPDEVYDRALRQAIIKAQNYLTPFFRYDLDEIYAIPWDGAADGGEDRDMFTVIADTLTEENGNEGFCGVSAYLPYGTYVAVEQQPREFANRHYRIDAPKEIILPAVYEDEAGTELAHAYRYRSADTPENQAAKYGIRFKEEQAYLPGRHVIRAHNADGDFEVYPYGLDLDQLTGAGYAGWKVTQDRFDPLKDYYNDPLAAPKEAGGNPDSHYYADDGNASNGRYEPDAIEKRYRYASISEDADIRDGTAVMIGGQTAREGQYAPMLVPWTVEENASGGYARVSFRNTFYSVGLRIEKLDGETGENILHDEAVFALYAASRDDSADGDGAVRFYDSDTVISGSLDFLKAMGAADLHTKARGIPDPDEAQSALWYGTVPAGTPVCLEEEQIFLLNESGSRVGSFRAFTTKRSGEMAAEDGPGLETGEQNAGYLELPRPLGAGVYVLAEIKPPAGYARSRPVAVEIYSDQTAYYRGGDKDRTAAVIYEGAQARVYVDNAPIRLEVSKKKTDAKTVTYRVSGRVEGGITELSGRYGAENVELAYNASGTYLGYGWKKGTAEVLKARKKAGEAVTMLYENGVFTGCAEITAPLLTAEDENRYVAGARLTLYDAIEVKKNGDAQDYAFDGVAVERDRSGNVTRMYVKAGYAGAKTRFGRRTDPGGGTVWTYETVRRPDTDILFFDLGGLNVLWRDQAGRLFSYGADGKRMQVVDGFTRSIYAIRQGKPVLEITGEHFEGLTYDPGARAFLRAGTGLTFYHLDADGVRDAQVDPYTGMAYVTEDRTAADGRTETKYLVWPVTVIRDRYGKTIARNKIRTFRIASIHADTDREYISGTYDSAGGGNFRKYLNPVLDDHGLVRYYRKSEERYKKSSPVYDRDGDFVYDRYDDGLADFNEDAYRIKTAGSVWDKGILWDPSDNREENLFMRQGDNYVLENTWISGNSAPNDPFAGKDAAGRADMLKRVVPGTYIMEELEPPEGYGKSFPAGVTVEEDTRIQTAALTDEKTKIVVVKADMPADFSLRGADYDRLRSEDGSVSRTEGKGAYSYGSISGARLAFYRAKKVYDNGWHVEKTGNTPVAWGPDQTAGGVWTTGDMPTWIEGLAPGLYLLEELSAPSGYIRTSIPVEVAENGEVQTVLAADDHTKLEVYKYQTVDGNKQAFPNTHAAELALYPAVTDADGEAVIENGLPLYEANRPVDQWTTDDCRSYTALTDLADFQKWGLWRRARSALGLGGERVSGFQHDFEAMYEEYGDRFDNLHWYYTDEPWDGSGEMPALREGRARREVSEEADRSGCVRQIWRTGDGKEIRITISPEPDGQKKTAHRYEYRYNYKRLAGNAVSYDLAEGCHRIDYLPWNTGGDRALYVLAETRTPEGYQGAAPRLIVLGETGEIQMYGIENKPEPVKPPETPETTEPETPPETTPEVPETTPPGTTEPTLPETSPQETPGIPETTPPETTAPRPGHPPDGGSEPESTTPPAWPTLVEIPPESPAVGNITARYHGGRRGAWGNKRWKPRFLARMGDRNLQWVWLTLAAVSGVGIVIGRRRRKNERKKRRKHTEKADKNRTDNSVDGGCPDSDERGPQPGGAGRDDSRRDRHRF